MNTAGQECIWKGQCGEECPKNCPDFTPADDSENNEKFYLGVLKESAEEYQHMIDDYSDEKGG